MSDQPIPADEPLAPAKENPESLVLRGRPRPAVRFRRGLIVGICGSVAASLVALAWLALDPPSFRKVAAAPAVDEVSGRPADDALGGLPKSYGDVPRLGPPLPGDLGRPILEQQRSEGFDMSVAESAKIDVQHSQAAAAEAERQRVAAARQAALSSALLVSLREAAADHGSPPPPLPAAVAEPAPSATPDNPGDPGAGHQRKIDFARSSDEEQSSAALRPAPSPWTLSAGTIIAASLLTGLNSDLPGLVLAQVTQPVRDTATGRTVLIPQGARLIGSYDSMIGYGQRRALLVWKRILFPDGSSITLDNMPATDAAGRAGVQDRVDSHGWQLLKGIGLSTLLGLGTQLSFGGRSELVRAIRESAQQNAAHAGDAITRRNLDVQPTLTVRPGWPIRAIVHKDLVLQPWRG